jgi:hypothetical protein
MSALAQTLRIAIRQLWKESGFTLTVVLTLALGIGAATAIFREPGRLMLIGDHLGGRDGIGVTAREIEIYTATTTAFASVGGYTGKGYETPGNEGSAPKKFRGCGSQRGFSQRSEWNPYGDVCSHAKSRMGKTGGGDQLRDVAEPISSRCGDSEKNNRLGQPIVYDHRGHAAKLRVSGAGGTVEPHVTMGSDELIAGGTGRGA